MKLPPSRLITGRAAWGDCLRQLQAESRLAIDLEANSMFAYRESICLIQVSTAGQDFIIDPRAQLDLEPFGDLLADETVEKVFHAAEYDLMLMKREREWRVHNLFDTMWAARILGRRRVGLASILGQDYGIKLNKRFQKSNWCRRPLSRAQLQYAQLDTHYLLRLRDDLAQQLEHAGRQEEAQEIFEEQSRVSLPDTSFDPESFWSINGVNEMSGRQRATVKALHVFRDSEARQRDRPPFKVFNDRTLIQLAKRAPANKHALGRVQGMTPGQIRRYGRAILEIIAAAPQRSAPRPPRRGKRLPEAVVDRYDRLHTWRKERARARGVESDVVLSRTTLWTIAHENPATLDELAGLDGLGRWRLRTYGQEILATLNKK